MHNLQCHPATAHAPAALLWLQGIFVSHVDVSMETIEHHCLEPSQFNFLLKLLWCDLDHLNLRLLLLVLLSDVEVRLAAEHTVWSVLSPLAPWDRQLQRSSLLNRRRALLRLLDWCCRQRPCLPEANLAVSLARDFSGVTLEDSL